MPVTTGMKGGGFYDEHSSPQLSAILAVLHWLEAALGQSDFADAATPIVVIDYGSSEGRNAITAMQRIVQALRGRSANPIQVVFSDLPTNNFNTLFVNLARAGWTGSDAQVYSAATGGSMFRQLMPRETVTVATTFNALGFLDHRPDVEIPNYILPMGPSRPRPGVEVADSIRKAYAAQAATDLIAFYRARADELLPGGRLLAASFGIGERYRCCDGIYDVLYDALLDLCDSGRLDVDALRRLVFPIYFRTQDELLAPLRETGSPAEGATTSDARSRSCERLGELSTQEEVHGSPRPQTVAGRFRIERAGSMEVPVPFIERWKESGDLAGYARDFSLFLSAFTEPILRQAFAAASDLDGLIDAIYQRVEARLLADPAAYEFHYVQIAALLTRI